MTKDDSYKHVGSQAKEMQLPFEPSSVTYGDIRSRQLEGTFPGDPMSGVWPISAQRIARGWGSVPESAWPQVKSVEDWPPPEPPGLDELAKERRIDHYQHIRNFVECCRVLAYQHPVMASFEITEDWYDAEGGVIPMPSSEAKIIGSHCITIHGFDIAHRFFRFNNWWGEDWGQNGYGYMSFDFFEKYLVSSWTMIGINWHPALYNFNGVDVISWGRPDLLGHTVQGGDILHGREVFDGTNDERIGWAFAVHRMGYLDVEELFVRPQYRGKGYGNELIQMLRELSAEVKQPLRLWVTFADWYDKNIQMLEHVAGKLNLTLYHSGVRWCPVVALNPKQQPRCPGLDPSSAPNPPKLNPVDTSTVRPATMLPKRPCLLRPPNTPAPPTWRPQW